jgi:hypothetical protein
VPPQIERRRQVGFAVQEPPCAQQVATVALRIAPGEVLRDGVPDHVVEREALCGHLDEGELADVVEAVRPGRRAQQGGQGRFGHAPNRGCRLDGLRRARRQPGEECGGELRQDLGRRAGCDVEVGLGPERRRRELERQRMSPCEAVHAGGLLLAEPPLLQQAQRVVGVEAPELDIPEEPLPARGGEPRRARGVAARHQRHHGVGKDRQERLTQPGVHEAEGLVGVEREHRPRAAVAEHPGDAIKVRLVRVLLEGGRDGAQKAARSGFDLAAVEQERASGRAHRIKRRLDETGLSDPSRPVDVGGDEGGLVGEDGVPEHLDLAPPPHERSLCRLADALRDGSPHDASDNGDEIAVHKSLLLPGWRGWVHG